MTGVTRLLRIDVSEEIGNERHKSGTAR